MALKHLDCSNSGITIIPPLPVCLETLRIGGTRCADFPPSAVCIGLLRCLSCTDTPVQDLSPLATCIGLRWLDCSHTPVRNLLPLLACMHLDVLECRSLEGIDDQTDQLLQAFPGRALSSMTELEMARGMKLWMRTRLMGIMDMGTCMG